MCKAKNSIKNHLWFLLEELRNQNIFRYTHGNHSGHYTTPWFYRWLSDMLSIAYLGRFHLKRKFCEEIIFSTALPGVWPGTPAGTGRHDDFLSASHPISAEQGDIVQCWVVSIAQIWLNLQWNLQINRCHYIAILHKTNVFLIILHKSCHFTFSNMKYNVQESSLILSSNWIRKLFHWCTYFSNSINELSYLIDELCNWLRHSNSL